MPELLKLQQTLPITFSKFSYVTFKIKIRSRLHTLVEDYLHMRDLWHQARHLYLVDAGTRQSVDYTLKIHNAKIGKQPYKKRKNVQRIKDV